MRILLLCILSFLFSSAIYAGVHAHYSFDTDYTDSSANGLHGNLVDTGTIGNSGIVSSPGSFKFGGGAMHFSSDRDYIDIPSKTFNSGRPYTIAFWARKEAGDSGDGGIWDMVIGSRNSTNFFISLGDTNGDNGLRWRSAGSTTDRQADFAVPRDYEWHHYAIVASGTTITLYLDGELFSTATGKLTGFTFDTIGEAYPDNRKFGFHGQLDEMWIFDEPLGPDAIARLHQTNDPGYGPSTATRLRVFLLAGQSNADGRAVPGDLPQELQFSQTDVDFYYKIEGSSPALTKLRPGLSESSQFGPEITLGYRLAKIYSNEPETRVAIIKYANGDTSLHTRWKAGGDATFAGDGDEYVIFQQTVRDGLAALAAAHPHAEIKLEGMMWMQGEADASTTGNALLYEANLNAFIADVRETFGQSLSFIVGRLSDRQTRVREENLPIMRAAQEAVAAAHPLNGLLDTDGFGMKTDNLHFDAAGQQSIGSGFAAHAAYYAWVVDHFSAEDIAAGLAEPEADRDGDGQSNRIEFLGATDPLSGASVFRARYERLGDDTGRISYGTSAGRTYSVQHFMENTGTWETILPAVKGTGSSVIQPIDDAASRRIYRVLVELPE